MRPPRPGPSPAAPSAAGLRPPKPPPPGPLTPRHRFSAGPLPPGAPTRPGPAPRPHAVVPIRSGVRVEAGAGPAPLGLKRFSVAAAPGAVFPPGGTVVGLSHCGSGGRLGTRPLVKDV